MTELELTVADKAMVGGGEVDARAGSRQAGEHHLCVR